MMHELLPQQPGADGAPPGRKPQYRAGKADQDGRDFRIEMTGPKDIRHMPEPAGAILDRPTKWQQTLASWADLL
ncbi:hypothetical protein [Methylobacillus flagellatus]|uniref:hypothetical protein n=1 Tax=Methylobacillus flagellatus TaxID=405 RepID=UPI002868BE03|nr:hypothetical protein [Methylobacillus flagellatus]